MARGPRHHLKRLAAPKHWYLSKMGGIFAPRPTPGPHKLRDCLPLAVLLRNKLRYALTYQECRHIARQRLIKVDNKVRTDKTFPCGFMDVVTIDKTNENFRLLFSTKGRFVCHKICKEEATYKLSKVRDIVTEYNARPHAYLTDGRTVRYPHPEIKKGDTVKIDLKTGKIIEWVKFSQGALAMITGGRSIGRVGVITKREKHMGTQEIVHLQDLKGAPFSTRITNVFVIGKENKSMISLPKDRGIKATILEEQRVRMLKESGEVEQTEKDDATGTDKKEAKKEKPAKEADSDSD